MTVPAYEKHSTTTDALDTLGSKIGPGEKRDAIHLAVEPAIAGPIPLSAGTNVMFDPATGIAVPCQKGSGAVGIVDPFLENTVFEGERFWLVVYPREIASLRHVWEHPSFAPSGETELAAVTEKPEHVLLREKAVAVRDKTLAEKWLRDYLADNFGITDDSYEFGQSTFDDIIDRASEGEDYISVYGTDAHGVVPDEFWSNLEIYVGHPVPHGREVYFSCSC